MSVPSIDYALSEFADGSIDESYVFFSLCFERPDHPDRSKAEQVLIDQVQRERGIGQEEAARLLSMALTEGCNAGAPDGYWKGVVAGESPD